MDTIAISKPFLFDGIPLYIEKVDITPNPEEIVVLVQVKGDFRLDLRFNIPRDQTACDQLEKSCREEAEKFISSLEKALSHES